MGSLLDAFGIYSNYRNADEAVALIGAEGFISSSQLMFFQDRYFVRIQVTGGTSIDQDILFACGRTVSANLPHNSARPRELQVMAGIPGGVTKSERYLRQSLLGYAFLRRGIISDAILGGERAQIFVVFEDSPAAARKAFDDYRSYLNLEGRDMNMTETTNRISLTAVDPLYGPVLMEQTGPYIIGAIRLKEVFTAKPLIEQLWERILKW
jgi:hypothetical protein